MNSDLLQNSNTQMEEKSTAGDTQAALSSSDLAFERTILSQESNMMAWVRTAISLISFGFTIYKILGETAKAAGVPHRLLNPRLIGMVMISFGLIALLLAQIQHHNSIKRIKKYYPGAQKSIASLLGFMVLLFGFALFLGALFRQ